MFVKLKIMVSLHVDLVWWACFTRTTLYQLPSVNEHY